MNCLLFIAIALLLIQLELRQAHDLVNESAHLLVNGRIVVRKLDFLTVVACLKIRFQFFARAAVYVQWPKDGQEFFNDLLRFVLGERFKLLCGNKDSGIGRVPRSGQGVREIESFEHRRRVDPVEIVFPPCNIRRPEQILPLIARRLRRKIRDSPLFIHARSGIVLSSEHSYRAYDQLDGRFDKAESRSLAKEFIRCEDRSHQFFDRMILVHINIGEFIYGLLVGVAARQRIDEEVEQFPHQIPGRSTLRADYLDDVFA